MTRGTSRLRVAIIGARGIPTKYGGWDAITTQLAPLLVDRGMDVTVYVQPRYSEAERPKNYNGARLVYLRALPVRALETFSAEAISLAHALFSRYDVIYVLGTRSSAIYVTTKLTRSELFFNTDGHDWERRKWSPRARRYLKWSEKFAARLRPSGLIADSQAIADYFAENYHAPAAFIPYGAPTLASIDPAPVLARGLEPGKYFLAVCRIEPENNIDQVVEAYAGLGTTMPLVIVGNTNYETEFSRKILHSTVEGVHTTGWIFDPNELDPLFHHAFAYLHGHEVGGTNPSLLHAMAASNLVMAKDVVYNREVLDTTGLYWTTPAELGAHMEHLLAHPDVARMTGAAALERVRKYYDWDAVADQYADLFRGAVAARRP